MVDYSIAALTSEIFSTPTWEHGRNGWYCYECGSRRPYHFVCQGYCYSQVS